MLICRRIFCIASLFLAGILHACLKHVLQILAGEPKEDKWVIKHLKKAAKSQRTMDSSAWGYSRWDSQSFVAAHPWYGTLSSRHKSEIELLESKMGPAEINNLIGDLSQDARDAFNRHEGRVGCVTPGGLLWHFGLKRPLLGIEKLALQGIFPTEAVMEPFSDSMKSQLAGNAFNAPDFTAVFISLMAVARPIMHVSCGVCVCCQHCRHMSPLACHCVFFVGACIKSRLVPSRHCIAHVYWVCICCRIFSLHVTDDLAWRVCFKHICGTELLPLHASGWHLFHIVIFELLACIASFLLAHVIAELFAFLEYC